MALTLDDIDMDLGQAQGSSKASGLTLDDIDMSLPVGEAQTPDAVDLSFDASADTQQEDTGLLPGAKRAPGGGQYMPSMIEGAVPEVLGSKELGAIGVGIGHAMQWTYRGAKQLLGIDEESMKKEEMLMDDLFENKRLGGYALGGELAGSIVEPMGLLLPGAVGAKATTALTTTQKAVRAATAASKGIALGAGYASIGYVNEDKGQTRSGNMMLGGTLGGVLAGGTSLISSTLSNRTITKATDLIGDVEKNFAQKILDGKDTATAMAELKTDMPKLAKELTKASEIVGRKPKLPVTQAQAQATIEHYKGINLGGQSALSKEAENLLGVVATGIKNRSEAAFGRLMRHDSDVATKSHDLREKADQFVKSYSQAFGKLKTTLNPAIADAKDGFKQALLNRDRTTATKLAEQYLGKDGVKHLDTIYGITKATGDDLVDAKVLKRKDLLPDYMPRLITNRKGFMKELGQEAEHKLQSAIDKANKTMQTKAGRPLTAMEEGMVIDMELRSFPKAGFKPTIAHGRTIVNIPRKFLKYYADPIEALHSHINESVAVAEKYRFFGQGNVATVKAGGTPTLDLNKSVGVLIQKEVAAGNLDAGSAKELSALLTARFGLGERAPTGWLQDVRNVTTAILLGNPISAAAQLTDVVASIFINGFKPTLQATVQVLTGRGQLTAKEFGFVDRIAEEFVSTRSTAKFLNTSLKYSLFSSSDRFAKAVNLNAQLIKFQKLATSDPSKIRKLYGASFADEIDDIIVALQGKKVTPGVKQLMWAELARSQPISRSEVPAAYLNHPNGRFAYMFKSYMLKQADVLRRDSFQEIKKGNRAKGVANLMRYGILMGSAGASATMVQDFMSGRDIEDIIKDASWDDIPKNLLKTFGYSDYVLSTAAGGSPVKAGFDIVVPPYDLFDRVWPFQFSEEDGMEFKDPEKLEKAIANIPAAGKMYYLWFGGGLEKLEERREKENE